MCKTQQQAFSSNFFVLNPMFILSGFSFPIASMPPALQWLTYLDPLRYFLVVVRATYLKGVGLEVLWPQMLGMAGATGGENAAGTAQRASGPSSGYAGRIAARIKPNIVFPDDIPGNPEAVVSVRTAPDGSVIGTPVLLKSSGVRSWDEAVIKAILRTEVLPKDIDGRVPSSMELHFNLSWLSLLP